MATGPCALKILLIALLMITKLTGRFKTVSNNCALIKARIKTALMDGTGLSVET
jgi:hypothetical protein